MWLTIQIQMYDCKLYNQIYFGFICTELIVVTQYGVLDIGLRYWFG